MWTIAGPPTSSVFPPLRLLAHQLAGDLADQRALGLLGRDAAGHEREIVRPHFAALLRKHAHAGVARRRSACRAATSVIGTQRADLPRRVDDDAAIHLLIGHLDPLAAEPHFGPLIRRAVEALRETRRPCRPRTSRQSCVVVGTAP